MSKTCSDCGADTEGFTTTIQFGVPVVVLAHRNDRNVWCKSCSAGRLIQDRIKAKGGREGMNKQ